jgi:predicted DNA-binding transcriptional regulator AlpA
MMVDDCHAAVKQYLRTEERIVQSIEELAARLGRSRNWVYERVKRGDIPPAPLRRGTRIFWPDEVVEEIAARLEFEPRKVVAS